MGSIIVRIREIELNNFKNTVCGLLQMPSALGKNHGANRADILGIYGQNGSGKTAMIEAMGFIQYLLTGKPLPKETVQYIAKDSPHARLRVKFSIQTEAKQVLIDYTVRLARTKEAFQIAGETLAVSSWNGSKYTPRKILIDYDPNEEQTIFKPIFRCQELIRSNRDHKVNLIVAKRIAHRENSSFIFGVEGRTIFTAASQTVSNDYAAIIAALYHYAAANLFVITNAQSGAFSLNLKETKTKGEIPIHLDHPTIVSDQHYHILKQIIKETSLVLCAVIPELTIDIHDFGEHLLSDGQTGHKIELISRRGQTEISLRYESEGIIKILSILNLLICIYNDPTACLFIDELDSGIYEYLLGELLRVFEKGARGQLVFTSHNMRALEMLSPNSIVFSTTNPSNRYLRLQIPKKTKAGNSLRDIYLRSITLGGQREAIYHETDSAEIGRAFRRSGKRAQDEK